MKTICFSCFSYSLNLAKICAIMPCAIDFSSFTNHCFNFNNKLFTSKSVIVLRSTFVDFCEMVSLYFFNKLHFKLSSVACCETSLHHLQSTVACCDTPLHHLQSTVATCDTPLHHLESAFATRDTPLHHLQSTVATCETSLHHMQSPVTSCDTSLHHMQSPVTSCDTPLHNLQSTVTRDCFQNYYLRIK